ncbi:MAG TPA: PAC2 family protein [Acidimicrobiales bacterium]|nr:PAC2 family protein [Acidimicrobiales bacterium]
MTDGTDRPLHRLVDDAPLREPVLVIGLEGWVDAGFGAGAAVSQLVESAETTLVATFDADVLVDHRSRRPVMHLDNGVNTGLTWPAIELLRRQDLDGRDLLLLTGTEPDIRWRAFTAEVVELAVRLGVRLAVGLGAYPAPVPHSRPVRLATTATDAELAQRSGEVHATLDVPAGVAAAIEERCAAAELPAVGLWAQVPHYAAGMAYPEASATLLEGLGRVSGLRLDTTELRQAARAHRERLDELVAANIEHTRMVRSLEAAYDAELGAPSDTAFTPAAGEELAAEVERFLRDLGSSGEPGAGA